VPRLSVFRSLKNISAQIIDDDAGVTLVAASSVNFSAKEKLDLARKVGQELAKKAKEKKITKVCFDRSGYAYHGRVKALADGARDGGLKF
jgi:large subunit ribosomal protein L18